MTDQNNKKPSTNKKPNNRNKRNRYNKNKPKAQASSEAGSPKKTSPSKKRNNNRNRRPKTLTPARVLQKYDNLLDQHLIARKKFSEVHARVSGKQLDKVVANLEKTRKALYEYESTLKADWQKEIIQKRLNLYPEDRQYSLTHNLEPKGDEVDFEGEFPDPHLLPTQKATQWSEDTEESTGSFEDYERYKQSV